MKRYTLLDQPAEMVTSPSGEFVRWEDVTALFGKCREMAEWHVGDGDECGQLAREVRAFIDALLKD